MTPINISGSGSCNGPQTGSNCTIWQGPDVPILGIKKGDSITKTLCTILNKIIELTTPLDLTTVSLQSLKDKLGVEEPIARSIANMLQIAYDASSTLKDLIDVAIAKIDNAQAPLALDMKCLGQFDSQGNQFTITTTSVLQTLINQVCDTKDIVSSLSGKFTTLQNQVDSLNVTPYTEPLVTSCLFSNKPASQAVVIIASDSCNYKNQVGQVTDIQSALGQIPSAWTQSYGLTTGWIVSPTNMAQSYQNLLLVTQNLENRITSMETSCCKVNCDSIIIDFDIKLSDDRQTATLFFATKSIIPIGFHEIDPLGTKLTVTDGAGAVYTTRVKLAEQMANADGFVIDLTATAIDPSQDFTFGMNITLTNGSLTCVKCVSKTAKYSETCSFCEITANNIGSSNSTAIITYQEIGSTKISSIILHPGDTQVIKKHVKILSVATDGPISLTSPCDINLNATETYQCVQIQYCVTNPGATGAWGVPADVTMTEIGYLDKKYSITGTGNVYDTGNLVNTIKAVLPVGVSLYTNIVVSFPEVGNRDCFKIVLKIPSSFIPSFYAKWDINGYSPLKIFAETCDDSAGACCPATSDTDTPLIG